VQWPALKLPVPFDANPTVPVGVLAVPDEVSVTVAAHVVACPIAAGLSEQLTLVVVERAVTGTALLPLVSPWARSPP
jgi:hypothetical protein